MREAIERGKAAIEQQLLGGIDGQSLDRRRVRSRGFERGIGQSRPAIDIAGGRCCEAGAAAAVIENDRAAAALDREACVSARQIAQSGQRQGLGRHRLDVIIGDRRIGLVEEAGIVAADERPIGGDGAPRKPEKRDGRAGPSKAADYAEPAHRTRKAASLAKPATALVKRSCARRTALDKLPKWIARILALPRKLETDHG